ncbi:hypothetical protein ACVGWD_06330, partial [Enterobacter asburiae]
LRTIETLLLLSERQLPLGLTLILPCPLLLDCITFPDKRGTCSLKNSTCVIKSHTSSFINAF